MPPKGKGARAAAAAAAAQGKCYSIKHNRTPISHHSILYQIFKNAIPPLGILQKLTNTPRLGRASSRIAAKAEEAQQLAVQAAEAAINAPAPPPDSSMGPPPSTTRGRGRGRGGRGNTENFARRGIPRIPRGSSSIADYSVARGHTPFSDAINADGETSTSL